MTRLLADEEQALSALASALAAPAALLEHWRSQELFDEIDSDGLCIRLGEPDSPAVRQLAQRYESTLGRPFPVLLERLLSRWNGLDLNETPDGAAELVSEPSVRHAWNGFLCAEEVESDEILDELCGLRIGTAYAQCRLILVDEGKLAGAVVFADGKGPTVVLARSLADFVRELATEGASVQAVVSRRL